MSAADLVDWLKNDRGEGAENVPAAGFVPWCPGARTEKGTPKIDPLRGRNGVCALVPAVPSIFVGVEVECMKSRPDQAANDAPTPATAATPAPADGTGAPALIDWRQADADYLRHHFTCPSCCAAGHGRGQRCATGAALWATYGAACEADRITNTKTRGRGAR